MVMKKILFKATIQGTDDVIYGTPFNVYNDHNHQYKWFDSMQYINDKGEPDSEYIESDTLVQLSEKDIEDYILNNKKTIASNKTQ
jgi:hypothetical protein